MGSIESLTISGLQLDGDGKTMVEVVHDVNSVYSERSQEQLWLLDKSAVR